VSGEIIRRPEAAPVAAGPRELTVDDLVGQVKKIHEAMAKVMRKGVHYGVIPGMDKPSLWKPGAEVLCMLFRLAPELTILRSVETAEEITFVVRCDLVQMSSGALYGSGLGSCSSREKKYGTREQKRKCPTCGAEAVFNSKYDPGFYCNKKAGGCGANFKAGDIRITDQPVGSIPNPDIWELHNTILKMAQKRAHIAAVLACTAASDSFTQDMEEKTGEPEPASSERKPPGNSHQPPRPPEPAQAQPGAPTMKQIRYFRRLCDELGVSEADAMRRAGEIIGREVGEPEDLTGAEISRVLDHMTEANKGGAE
jgi:hypothetical protein